MRAFLSAEAPPRPPVAVDLGCGPGYSTRILTETVQPKLTFGIDSSDRFLEQARTSTEGDIRFLAHDVTVSPLPIDDADVMFAHLLLTHVVDPSTALTGWAAQLAPGGIILVDEVERIDTHNPVLQRYLEIVAALIGHGGGQLYVGRSLEQLPVVHGLVRRSSGVVAVPVSTASAAKMFRLNLKAWRDHPFVVERYGDGIDALAKEIEALTAAAVDGEIEWGMRQIVYQRNPDPA